MTRGWPILAGFLLLAGCQSSGEIAAQIQEVHRQSCLAAGFTENTDEYRLCLVLQETNRRVDRLDSRLSIIEADRFTFGRGLRYY